VEDSFFAALGDKQAIMGKKKKKETWLL